MIRTDVGKAEVTEAGARDGCELARLWCDRGKYAEAAEALSFVWDGPGAEPQLAGLSAEAAADVLLMTGVVEGFLGKSRRTAGAQERSKDLIGRALFAFEGMGLAERAASAQIGLAVCYYREGAYDEARLLLGGALERVGVEDRLRALLWAAQVEVAAKCYDDALRLYERAAPLATGSGDDMRRGSFHNNRGQALFHIGEQRQDGELLARAAKDFEAALIFFGRAGHSHYAGYTLNNFGCLQNAMGLPAEAHLSLDRAREIFEGLKDGGCMAQVDDTRARVLIGEGRNEEAVAVSARAVELLSQSDDYGLLVNALTTHATALARDGRSSESAAAFSRAIALADERIGGGEGKRIQLVMVEELAYSVYQQAGISYWDAVWRIEHRMLKGALEATGGVLNEAAMKLGLGSYQSLQQIIKGRHRELLARKKTRRRSIINPPKAEVKSIKKGKKTAKG